MANYINKYENATAYDADKAKQYPNVSYIEETDEIVWLKNGDYSKDYLTFVALEDGTFKLSSNSINYSLDDGQTWTSLASNTDSPTVTAGNKILWKASGLTAGFCGIGKFISSGQFEAQGNIMSLVSGDSFANATVIPQTPPFRSLFSGNTNIVSAENLILPATTLAGNSYNAMFQGCTSLTTAPKLPATTLALGCYYGMFSGCTSLTAAPELPATALAPYCYQNMFSGCTSLTSAPELPATTLTPYCYNNMFQGCTSLTAAPQLPATTLASNCYDSMFDGCTSLTAAPQLPATTLASNCYCAMFQGCTSLAIAPELPATTLAESCYSYMFQGCTSLTTAPELPATTLAQSCYQNMFRGCTSLTSAPALPATTLIDRCYNYMFNGCTSLNSITCLATDISAGGWGGTGVWVNGVASTGTFTKAASMTSWPTGSSGIPTGWTVVDAQ